MSTEVKKLTKKQQKAAKFRSGDRKKPEEPEQLAVPEQDIVDDEQTQPLKKGKKRKRDSDADGHDESDPAVKKDPANPSAKTKSAPRKTKQGADGKVEGNASRKSRYIVFVGE